MLCRCQLPSTALLLVAHRNTLEKMDGTLPKARFFYNSKSCILRKTADLLLFTLHRFLSVTSVKVMCCQNAIPHTLRDELTCGSFQLYIWRLNLQQTLSFDSPLYKKMMFRLTKDIINQSEPEKQDEYQNLKIFDVPVFGKMFASKNNVLVHFTSWKRPIWYFSFFFKKHDFQLKNPLRVRFWIEKKHNASDFEFEKKYNAS